MQKISIEENLIFRAVHDYIIHIKNNTSFSGKDEIRSYNFHAKVAPKLALPALFTEVVGQACYYVHFGSFPIQKIAILEDFDLEQIGKVTNHTIIDKKLVKTSSY